MSSGNLACDAPASEEGFATASEATGVVVAAETWALDRLAGFAGISGLASGADAATND